MLVAIRVLLNEDRRERERETVKKTTAVGVLGSVYGKTKAPT